MEEIIDNESDISKLQGSGSVMKHSMVGQPKSPKASMKQADDVSGRNNSGGM